MQPRPEYGSDADAISLARSHSCIADLTATTKNRWLFLQTYQPFIYLLCSQLFLQVVFFTMISTLTSGNK